MITDMFKVALPVNRLVGTQITREQGEPFATLRVLAFDMVLERGALNGGVGTERTLVGPVAGMPHLMAPEGIVIAGAIRAKVAAEKGK